MTATTLAAAAYETAISRLDTALRDATAARADLALIGGKLELMEARAALAIEGRNEVERKARLVVAMAESDDYQEELEEQADARAALADAERRIVLSREQCRLDRLLLEAAIGERA